MSPEEDEEVKPDQRSKIPGNQGKNVFKATGFRCCHCFPCTMLPGLRRANWSPEAGGGGEETVLSV